MAPLSPFLLPVLAPLLTVVGAAWLLKRSQRSGAERAWGGGLLVVLAVWVGAFAVDGAPTLWPVEASDHLLPLSLVAFTLGAARLRLRAHPVAFVLALGLLNAAWLQWLLQPLIRWTWSPSEALVWCGALWFIWTTAWASAALVPSAIPAKSVAGVIAITTGLGAFSLAATGSIKLGQLQGALGVGLAVFALLGLRWGQKFPAHSALSVAVPLCTLLLTAGVVFSELPPAAGGLLAIAPLTVLAGWRDEGAFPWRGALSALVVAGIGLVLAIALSPPPAPSYGQY